VRVAEQLGLDVDDVEASLLGLPREQVSSIEVQAVGKDSTEVVAMADAAAAELLVVLKSRPMPRQRPPRQIVARLTTSTVRSATSTPRSPLPRRT
jgi:hypothetical protein